MGKNFLAGKSWHTGTIKNMAAVWEAEQKAAAEKKRIEELQKELQRERSRKEIMDAATRGSNAQERVDWMYQTPMSAQVSSEEYLTGKAVDTKEEVKAAVNTLGLFQAKEANPTQEAWNKVMEDPLFAIQKREKESLDSIKSNPVKMKQIREKLLAMDKGKGKEKKKGKLGRESKQERRERKERKREKREREKERSDRSDQKRSRENHEERETMNRRRSRSIERRERKDERRDRGHHRSRRGDDSHSKERESSDHKREGSRSPRTERRRETSASPIAHTSSTRGDSRAQRTSHRGDRNYGSPRRDTREEQRGERRKSERETRDGTRDRRDDLGYDERRRRRDSDRDQRRRDGRHSDRSRERSTNSRREERESDIRDSSKRDHRPYHGSAGGKNHNDSALGKRVREDRDAERKRHRTGESTASRESFSLRAGAKSGVRGAGGGRGRRRSGLTEEERLKRLAEMQSDAEMKVEQRLAQIQREEVEDDTEQAEYKARAYEKVDFIDSMNKKIYTETEEDLEDRLRRNKHFRQKGNLDERSFL